MSRAKPLLAGLLAMLSWPVAAGATPSLDRSGCPRTAVDATPVPNLAAVLARHEPAVVVAVGSSSTRSWLASDPAHSYPAVLQDALERALPHAHVAVLNRGVNGEDVTEELARLDSDVIAVHPTLVIWQVGANGALRSADPAAFRKLVTAGVARLHAGGADVILMDNQRAPRLMAAPDNPAIEHALSDVARDTEAELFSRSELMDGWAASGYPNTLFLSSDNLHHNDLGYRCVAEALAASIVAGLGVSEPGASGPGSTGGHATLTGRRLADRPPAPPPLPGPAAVPAAAGRAEPVPQPPPD